MVFATWSFSAIVAYTIYKAAGRYHRHQRHIALAKSSGLPVVSVPWNIYNRLWLATFKFWTLLLRKILPSSLTGLWLEILQAEWTHVTGHKYFKEIGKDIFVAAAPSGLTVYVANAEAITQITARRNDFPKPLEIYKSLNIYGKSLVTTEGSEWRSHRKLVAPSFGERNNELVWNETLHHAKSLLSLWAGPEGRGNKTINDPSVAAMNFALYIISSAGFDVRVTWPHEEGKEETVSKNTEQSISFSSKAPPGHTMSFREALSELLHNIIWTQIIPIPWLEKSPFTAHRTVAEAAAEWRAYMNELYEIKKAQFLSGEGKRGMDVFESLIRGSGITGENPTTADKSDILGNAFVIMLAGHETTANTLHFSLIFLAMYWASQKRLQQDIDRIFNGRPTSEWTYEEHFPKLFASMPAAVMNETLRLLQPIVNIPKSVTPDQPQTIQVDGQSYTIPAGANVFLCSSVHRNPKYWPAPENDTIDDGMADPDRFRPERWFTKNNLSESYVEVEYDDEALRGPSGEDTSSELFKPVRGSYIPFSDGGRSCIGRRFAQAEVLAVLAAIFSQYSVELAVDDFASDEEVEKMPKGGQERRELYKKAVDRAQHALRYKVASIITLQLRGTSIPIRLMKRGEERFAFD
ncbi:hypothetical protein COCMIDRAFT_28840 [Bipolaris oryzae ATCC 44560]|uniref:Cytochrome P450 monooxygenase n=1 Tax=Bipolaris oryzae ATCC 44560 TaxID=930090 RepID=W6YSZ1_COCMI|nr:uncharacterized protein COCMIDRAFT_28840 [Bipolaris oryzae ATCC 44560]EUC42557.1 hypothetical protein COCMIDRAFT_28840 [Bipolaris oryzae ATCC 44560]